MLYIIIIIFLVLFIVVSLLILHEQRYITNKIPPKADYLIIGGGVAGCVLARRLSEKYPNDKIVILERGKDRRHEQKVYRTDLAGQIVYKLPYSESLETNYQNIMASSARMYGGGSSHNYGLVVESSDQYYKNYTNINQKLYRDSVYRMMSNVRVSENVSFSPSLNFVPKHNLKSFILEGLNVFYNLGPLGMKEKDLNKFTRVFHHEIPSPIVDNYNGYLDSIGKNHILFNDSTNGVRGSVNRQYLPDKFYHKNLIIVEEAEVDHIEEPTVYLMDGRSIDVNKKIIVSAGAIHTPRIIQRSNSLTYSKVGKKLQNHYGYQIILAMKDLDDFTTGPVIYTSDQNKTRREFQCIVSKLINYPLLDKNNVNYKKYVDEGYQLFSFTLFLLNPSGYGDVTLEKVNLSMYNDEDTIKLEKSYQWLTKIYQKLGAIKIFPNDWRDSIMITDHYSCSMKETVDDNYKLLSSKMTYIVDTSVFSEIPDSNTEFPTLILAEHASNII